MRTSDLACLKSTLVIRSCNLSKPPVVEECSRPVDLDEVQDRLLIVMELMARAGTRAPRARPR